MDVSTMKARIHNSKSKDTSRFWVDFTIDLPFTPFRGLLLDVPADQPQGDTCPRQVEIASVKWDSSRSEFQCSIREYHDW